MRELDLLEMRVLPRVFPKHPYARHTVGLGAGESALPQSATVSSSNLLNIKVVGIYCSRGSNIEKDIKKEKSQILSSGNTDNLNNESQESVKRHIYVRVQFDKVLVDTLPLEVMREKYPQVLIDYLLSTAVWT